jgi:hypothetical protein
MPHIIAQYGPVTYYNFHHAFSHKKSNTSDLKLAVNGLKLSKEKNLLKIELTSREDENFLQFKAFNICLLAADLCKRIYMCRRKGISCKAFLLL